MKGFTLNRKELSLHICAASMLAYCIWLLLPVVQTTGRAVTGAATVALFVAGILLDVEEWRKNWLLILFQAGCAAVLPYILLRFMHRGGDNGAGFYVSNVMLWYPLIYVSYALRKKDERLWRYLKVLLTSLILITVLSTISGTLYGMLVEKSERTYPRLLGTNATDPQISKKLMLRNIGGYDFVYASVMTLPFLCFGAARAAGWKKAGYISFAGLVVVMIVLSQYTYAMIYAGMILVVEFFAWLAGKIFKTTPGRSMLIGLIPLVLICLMCVPLLSWAMQLTDALHLKVLNSNLARLHSMLTGATISSGDRLGYYSIAWKGFAASPLFGSMFGSEFLLSQHSEVMDMLSGIGIVGTLCVAAMIGLMQKGFWKAAKKSEAFPHLVLMGAALLLLNSFGTSFYSRDVWLICSLNLLLTSAPAITPRPLPGEGSSDTLPKAAE